MHRHGAEWPMYINVIREPLERKVSGFYYHQYNVLSAFKGANNMVSWCVCACFSLLQYNANES